jgi:hypothetical protein
MAETEYERLEGRRKQALIFIRNRRKILRSVPPEQKRAYLKACDDAWKEGRECPPFPWGRVPSAVEL